MRSGDRSQQGYTLVAIMMIVTVLTVMVAAVLPLWSAQAQREKEEELISRGFQYAEAIRVFQRRFGRLPNRLEELIETEPRSIRQLWKDPMTEDGAWGVIVEVPGGGFLAVDSRTGQPLVPPDLDGDGVPDPRPAPPPPPPGGGTVAVGPIHGVKSRASGEAYHLFFELEDYGEWEFTVELLQKSVSKPGPTGMPPRSNALIFGRPFRFPPPGQVPTTPGGVPGGPGGQPGQGPGGGRSGPPIGGGDKGG